MAEFTILDLTFIENVDTAEINEQNYVFRNHLSLLIQELF